MSTLKIKPLVFATYVQEQTDVVNDPFYVKDALEERHGKKRMKQSISSLLVTAQPTDSLISCPDSDEQFDNELSIYCNFCYKTHKLSTCKFRTRPADNRCEYLKANNLCVLSLSNGHSECQST